MRLPHNVRRHSTNPHLSRHYHLLTASMPQSLLARPHSHWCLIEVLQLLLQPQIRHSFVCGNFFELRPTSPVEQVQVLPLPLLLQPLQFPSQQSHMQRFEHLFALFFCTNHAAGMSTVAPISLSSAFKLAGIHALGIPATASAICSGKLTLSFLSVIVARCHRLEFCTMLLCPFRLGFCC